MNGSDFDRLRQFFAADDQFMRRKVAIHGWLGHRALGLDVRVNFSIYIHALVEGHAKSRRQPRRLADGSVRRSEFQINLRRCWLAVDGSRNRDGCSSQLDLGPMNLDYIAGQVVGNLVVERDGIAYVYLANLCIFQAEIATGNNLATGILDLGVARDLRFDSVKRGRIQELLHRAHRDLIHAQVSVKVCVEQVRLLDWATFAIQNNFLFTLAGQMSGGLDGKFLVRGKIADRQINVVVNGPRLMLLQISDGHLAVSNLQVGKLELARGLLAWLGGRLTRRW